ncbi:hypothetical protein ACQJBY_034748 [Aegilops geniculata]
MAPAGRDGENTRFPLLATVRSLVTIVVTVLAVSVVVMVIVVVHRPVDMGFQCYGYVLTEKPWWIQHSTTTAWPATAVDYLIVVKALNPSGRGQIHGSINVVRLLDVPNASFAGMVDLGWFKPESGPFDLPPHSKHRYRDWRHIDDQPTLQYLYDKHGHQDAGFTVMVVVNATYQPAHSKKSIDAAYYCWPVTFIRIDATSTPAADNVDCKTAQEMGVEVKWETPPPATA